jgi:hypothetical protein
LNNVTNENDLDAEVVTPDVDAGHELKDRHERIKANIDHGDYMSALNELSVLADSHVLAAVSAENVLEKVNAVFDLSPESQAALDRDAGKLAEYVAREFELSEEDWRHAEDLIIELYENECNEHGIAVPRRR